MRCSILCPSADFQALRDWLTSLPSSLQPAEIRRGYLPYTKNKLKHVARSGTSKAPASLVRSLDPDAVLRSDSGSAKTLEAEDVAYEKALLRSLFGYIRSGALDLAIDMCRQSDQSWRAASLAGAQPYLDRVVVPTEDEDDDESMANVRLPSSGNVNRRLWKAMARKLASNVALSPYERALYGALSGDVASVLPVCETWEDQLWAHASALLEDHLERGLVTSRDGRFWTQAVAVGADASTASAGSSHAASVRDGLAEIFRRLDASERPSVRDASANIFHFAQRHLALGTVPELLDTFAARIQSLADDLDPRCESVAVLVADRVVFSPTMSASSRIWCCSCVRSMCRCRTNRARPSCRPTRACCKASRRCVTRFKDSTDDAGRSGRLVHSCSARR